MIVFYHSTLTDHTSVYILLIYYYACFYMLLLCCKDVFGIILHFPNCQQIKSKTKSVSFSVLPTFAC